MNRLSQLLAVVAAAALVAPPCALAQMPSAHTHDFPSAKKANSPLIDKVRAATSRFVDVNVAIHEGWVPGTPCVSGPNSGAMGVHYLFLSRLFDGILNANEPESLIYEPLPNGALRLVGVEFIVLAADWASKHPDGSTPAVDGHLTNFVDAPNRYGLPAFYELHVWAWEHNPNGSFADWNTQVSCDNQLPQ
jgi:hypothetical protein